VHCFSSITFTDSSKFPERTQRKHQSEADLECYIVVDSTLEVHAPDISLHAIDRNKAVAFTCSILFSGQFSSLIYPACNANTSNIPTKPRFPTPAVASDSLRMHLTALLHQARVCYPMISVSLQPGSRFCHRSTEVFLRRVNGYSQRRSRLKVLSHCTSQAVIAGMAVRSRMRAGQDVRVSGKEPWAGWLFLRAWCNG